MQSSMLKLLATLAALAAPAGAHRLLRSKLPGKIDPSSDAINPLNSVEDIADPVEDIELRQKPPHVLPEEASPDGMVAADLTDILQEKMDDMRNCIVIHQYAEPLEVGDAVREIEDVYLSRGNESNSTKEKKVPPLVRQGAIWDDGASQDSVPLAIEMFAQLQGISGMVQVIPHGPMSQWTSKEKVPIGGFLCSHNDKEVGAPVLHATPTPCVPTALDSSAQALDPIKDGYEVFIGTTRVFFDSKKEANIFCQQYAMKIANDITRNRWDASALGEVLAERNPNITTFISNTGFAPANGWTKGRKKLLVVVMDWKYGDNTLAPYSQQEANPIPKYRDVIFPAVNAAFEKMSYGQFGVDVDFVPQVVRYNRDRNRYTARKMPFPALYDAARESVEGQLAGYSFNNYDLVYVIAPQVRPTGTKGVAWVGLKGAMCNGCETISDNFKIMVAVHELGHNLGLSHASSTSLEYGNPFDWMGNYPDVVGLNYGVGYVVALGWLSTSAIYTVTDQNLPGLSTEVVITPHDLNGYPAAGQVAGIKVSLSANARDLWVAFRASPDGGRAGIFLTWQEKNEANSELIDAACHSPSQQDAHMRVGWIYLDKSHTVAMRIVMITEAYAKVHIFEAKPSDVPKIYGQPTFTDGETKCPVTCQDANWLVTAYNCPDLAAQGYCSGGALTLQGTKYSIGLGICPQECGMCDQVIASTPLKVSTGCQDKNIKISGKSCRQVALSGWCGYETKSGSSVGKDLCPLSCGQCPKAVSPSSEPFTPPAVRMTVGGGAPAPPPPATFVRLIEGEVPVDTPSIPADSDVGGAPASAPAGSPSSAPGGAPEEEGEEDGDSDCEDDPSWKDAEGDTCAEYAKVIEAGTWTQAKACAYENGAPKLFCRKTCETCTVSNGTCADSTCISTIKIATGRCEQCNDYARYCTGKTAAWFRIECPLTCGVCKPNADAIAVAPPNSATDIEMPTAKVGVLKDKPKSIVAKNATPTMDPCFDEPCVVAWKVGSKCPSCHELGESFCAEEDYAMACKSTCKLCTDTPISNACKDVFSTFTCTRYKSYGWCTREDMRAAVARQCPLTCGTCSEVGEVDPRGNNSNVTPGSPGYTPYYGEAVTPTRPLPEAEDEGANESEAEGNETKEEGGKDKSGAVKLSFFSLPVLMGLAMMSN